MLQKGARAGGHRQVGGGGLVATQRQGAAQAHAARVRRDVAQVDAVRREAEGRPGAGRAEVRRSIHRQLAVQAAVRSAHEAERQVGRAHGEAAEVEGGQPGVQVGAGAVERAGEASVAGHGARDLQRPHREGAARAPSEGEVHLPGGAVGALGGRVRRRARHGDRVEAEARRSPVPPRRERRLRAEQAVELRDPGCELGAPALDVQAPEVRPPLRGGVEAGVERTVRAGPQPDQRRRTEPPLEAQVAEQGDGALGVDLDVAAAHVQRAEQDAAVGQARQIHVRGRPPPDQGGEQAGAADALPRHVGDHAPLVVLLGDDQRAVQARDHGVELVELHPAGARLDPQVVPAALQHARGRGRADLGRLEPGREVMHLGVQRHARRASTVQVEGPVRVQPRERALQHRVRVEHRPRGPGGQVEARLGADARDVAVRVVRGREHGDGVHHRAAPVPAPDRPQGRHRARAAVDVDVTAAVVASQVGVQSEGLVGAQAETARDAAALRLDGVGQQVQPRLGLQVHVEGEPVAPVKPAFGLQAAGGAGVAKQVEGAHRVPVAGRRRQGGPRAHARRDGVQAHGDGKQLRRTGRPLLQHGCAGHEEVADGQGVRVDAPRQQLQRPPVRREVAGVQPDTPRVHDAQTAQAEPTEHVAAEPLHAQAADRPHLHPVRHAHHGGPAGGGEHAEAHHQRRPRQQQQGGQQHVRRVRRPAPAPLWPPRSLRRLVRLGADLEFRGGGVAQKLCPTLM